MPTEVKKDDSMMWRKASMIGGVVLVVILFLAVLGAAARGRMFMRGEQFGMMHGGFQRQAPAGGMMRTHMRGSRAEGLVTKIDGNSVTVRLNGVDQAVNIQSTTSFYKAGAIAKQSDLQASDVVRVQGAPDSNGVIQATSVAIE